MFYLNTPEAVFSGKGSVKELSLIIRKKKICEPLVIIDSNVKNSNFGKSTMELLSDVPFYTFSAFSTNPTITQVTSFFERGIGKKFDGVIAIGGGSAIDIAKAINIVLSNGEHITEYLEGKPIDNALLPFIAIPTTCGTGSESSPYAVISDLSIPKKRGIESHLLVPNIVILDVCALRSLDRIMVAATAIDCLAHVLESHISKKASTLTLINSRGLLISLGKSLKKAIFELDERSLETLLYIAFAARLLYPRTGLSVAHALSHPIGAHTNLHHGMSVALFLVSSLRFNLPYCSKKIQETEYLLGLKENKISLVRWIEELIDRSGIALSIQKYLSGKDIPVEQIAKDGLLSSNIPSNPRPISVSDAVDIVEDALASIGA